MDIWVGIFASLWSVVSPSLVEDVHLINIHRSLLNSVDLHVSEESSSFPHGGNEAGANHRFSIVVLSRVLPPILLNDYQSVTKVHASFIRLERNLGNVEALGFKMEIE